MKLSKLITVPLAAQMLLGLMLVLVCTTAHGLEPSDFGLGAGVLASNETIVVIHVIDENNTPAADIAVQILNDQGDEVASGTTDGQGNYNQTLITGKAYSVIAYNAGQTKGATGQFFLEPGTQKVVTITLTLEDISLQDRFNMGLTDINKFNVLYYALAAVVIIVVGLMVVTKFVLKWW